MKLLMHTCCAPCSVSCVEMLEAENIKPTLYFYNPNIHPYMEYKNRKDTLIKYSELINIDLIIEDEYGLRTFCENVVDDINNRCINYCYEVRFRQTAKYAKENGFSAITSTLFISPYQKHDEMKILMKKIADEYELEFVYMDFRLNFREGQAKARSLELYMQKYCGCIFSEEDRYLKEKRS